MDCREIASFFVAPLPRSTSLLSAKLTITCPPLKIWKTALAILITLCLGATVQGEDNPLPDPKLTPGRVAKIRQDRHRVTEEMERQVFRIYQIPWERRAEFKIDHLIPVELGGADTIDNLWPQSLLIKPYSVKRKEYLTKQLLALIAARRMTLADAQKEIKEDWISCFVDRVGMAYLQ